MADHALVVGCDSYPHVLGGDLSSAVSDAVAMRSWLIGPAGVPPENVTLLLSGDSTGGVAPDGPADRSVFAMAISNLIQRTDADRLYVYFAGHGCRSDPQNPVLGQGCAGFHRLCARRSAAGRGRRRRVAAEAEAFVFHGGRGRPRLLPRLPVRRGVPGRRHRSRSGRS